MTRYLLPFLLFFTCFGLYAQNFTWMKGRDTINKKGYFSVQGVSSPTNNPGAREGAVSWRDNSGNLWLFGGYGYDRIGNFGHLNDLWKFDPTSNNWTWMHGNDIFIQTGSYGTSGLPNASNKPGARQYAASCTDAQGNFWLFGGSGYGSTATLGFLNDLWRYDVVNSTWTWINGAASVNQSANYGTQGVAAASNMPGGRLNAHCWMDGSGNIWLMGGRGYDANGNAGYLNDLWKYDMLVGQWVWISGSSLLNQNGVYGTQGTAAATNMPGARVDGTAWKDQAGDLWLFGGNGYDASNTTTVSLLNDLWKYNIATNQWTWVKGSNSVDQNGVYGSQGTAAAANTPGSRYGAVAWIDAVSNVWLLGGYGLPITGPLPGPMQDLWLYKAGTNDWTWIKGGGVTLVSGVYGTMGTPSGGNVLGARVNPVTWIDNSNNLWLFGGYGRAAASYTAPGYLNDLWKYTNCYTAPQTISISSADSVICVGETTTLNVSGGTNYLWNNGNITNFTVVHPTITTTYSATSTDTNSCTYKASFTQSVDLCTGLSSASAGGQETMIYPNPNPGKFVVKPVRERSMLTIFNSLGQLVYSCEMSAENEEIKTHLSPAVYFFQLSQGIGQTKTGKLIVE